MGKNKMIKQLLKIISVLFKTRVPAEHETRAKDARPKHRRGDGPWMYSDTNTRVDKKDTLSLYLDRRWYTDISTIGELSIDGEFECYILEDYDRLSKGKVKKYGETAIPTGIYNIRITYSPRFKCQLPILENVPGFRGIRIHPGNTAKDTEGCLLPGLSYAKNKVGQSRWAFNQLFKKLERAKRDGKKIIIEVSE